MTLAELLAARKGATATTTLALEESVILEESSEDLELLLSILLSLTEVSNARVTIVDNYAGFRLLKDWLLPSYTKIKEPPHFLLSNICGSYNLNEMAKILDCHPQYLLNLVIPIYFKRKELILWNSQKKT